MSIPGTICCSGFPGDRDLIKTTAGQGPASPPSGASSDPSPEVDVQALVKERDMHWDLLLRIEELIDKEDATIAVITGYKAQVELLTDTV